MQKTKSLYKTHEKKFNENLIYPMNSISSLFYIIPFFTISSYFGKFVLFGLTVSSTLWWAKQTKISHYFDLLFLISTLIWSLSVITYNNKLNYFIIPIIFLKNNNNFYKNLIIIFFMIFLLISETNYKARTLFILSIVSKLSDTYCGNKYGTALFHMLSAFSICFI